MFKSFPRKSIGRNKAQVAIALLFVVAIALIFYAFTQNVGKMSQTKALVTVASNTAAADLASKAASYGAQLQHTNLGGKKKKCGLTGAFAALIGVIIAIIGAVLAIFTFGAGIALSVVGIALAAGGLAIQTMVVEPMISNAWTKMMKELLTDNERYIEGSLQQALLIAATDPVKVPDNLDMDGDRRFTGAPAGDDEISRFSLLYQKRINDMGAGGYVAALNYINYMDKFVYNGGNPWSLTDKPGNHCEFSKGDSFVIQDADEPPYLVPSECNPCCLPESQDNPDDSDTPFILIADSCDGVLDNKNPPENAPPGYRSSTCEQATPYPGYPYVYEKIYQDPSNNHFSFLEQIGRDDQHPDFNRRFFEAVLDEDPAYNAIADLEYDSNGDGDPTNDAQDIIDRYGHPEVIPQGAFGMRTGSTPYYFGDVDNYYEEDRRMGVYPFFWQAKHFGLDLNDLTLLDRKYPEVVWCDWDSPANRVKAADGTDLDSTPAVDENGDGNAGNDYVDPDLADDFDGDGDPANDTFSLYCVKAYEDMVVMNDIDGVKTRVQQLDLGPMDGVLYETTPFVDGPLSNQFSDTDDTVDSNGDGNYTNDPDSPNPPLGVDNINEVNQKYLNLFGIHPAEPDKDIWREGSDFFSSSTWPYQFPLYYQHSQMDRMDWIYYGLQEYLVWAQYVLSNNEFAGSQMEHWMSDFVSWRQRLISVNTTIDNTLTILRAWRDHTYKTPCQGNGAAWCIPQDPSECSSPPPPEEMDTFGEGKMEDVAACLEWNSGPNGTANADRFNNCLSECSADACTNLPRSLVPNFNPNDFTQDDLDSGCDPAVSEWAANIQQSAIEANVQGIKMAMRAKYLRSLIYRRDHLIDVLQEGYNNIAGMIAYPLPTLDTGTSSSVIYGWQEKPNPELDLPEGRWHYVRVDAKLPAKLPWIKTYNTGLFKMKRCYELTNTDGKVEVRVTRFDQPYSDEEKLKVKFANDSLLWKFWTINPLDALKWHNLDMSGVPQICEQDNAFARTGGPDSEIIEGAFITRPGTACAAAVQPALDLGVTTCTAANYGFQNEQGGGGNPNPNINHLNGGFAFTFDKCN